MSERDHFEAWAEEAGALPWGRLKKQRNPSGGYSLQVYTYMWQAWQASREALKAEQSSDSGFMFVPVADLYAISTPETKYFPSYTTYTPHAEDASRAISDGCEIQEYVKLERLQDAMNNPIDTTPNQYDALGKGERK